jgi:hypothetical protein
MALPDVTVSITDGALGLLPEATDKIVAFIGVASSGTVETLYAINDLETLQSTFGYGPLVEAAAMHLSTSGGPIYCMRATGSTAGSNSAVTASGGGPTVTLSGAPYDDYTAIVKVVLGGARGTATFKYSLDNGSTYSPVIVTAATYLIPGTGVTVNFASGTYVADETYSWTSTAPGYSTTNLGACVDAYLLDSKEWGLLHVIGVVGGADEATKASNAATFATALQTKMTTAQTAFRYARAVMSAPDIADAALTTGFTAVSAARVAVGAGFATMVPVIDIVGRTTFSRPAIWAAMSKIGKKPLGKDPAELTDGNGTGPLPFITALGRDERKTPALDAERFTTFRTHLGRGAIPYVTNFKLMSAPGSDFKYIQHGQVIDNGCKITRDTLLDYLHRDLKVNANFTIDELEAQAIERAVLSALNASLTQPGHVSECTAVVNRTDNIVSTETLRVKVRIRPKAYPKFIEAELGFAALVAETT